MVTIRLKKRDWAKAWRAMIEIGSVRLIRDDPVYVVEPAHLELLTRLGYSYEVVPPGNRNTQSQRNGTTD